jgi:uncharacterized coiled-coil protein SlyX
MRFRAARSAASYAFTTPSRSSTAMFAKRTKPSSKQPPRADGGGPTAPPEPDPRDAAIERLERELAEQRETAQTLRESLDAATFKMEILEKSYAKQLAEARDSLAATASELKEKEEILANLGGGHEHTLRELNDALTVIKVLKTERDQLRKQIAQGGLRQRGETKAQAILASGNDSRGGTTDASHSDTSGGTINALIANAGWAEKKPSAGASPATAQVEAGQQQPHEEMLSPDLVFTAKDKEKEADDER